MTSTTTTTTEQADAFQAEALGLDGVREVRVFGAADPAAPGGNFRGDWFGYFPDAESATKAALHASDRCKAAAVYLTLNPVAPELLAVANGRLVRAKRGAATSDRHILRRANLLIDCDAKKPASDMMASAAEQAAAVAKRDLVRDFLRDRGWPEPAGVTESGNGGGLIYAIDLPNDDESLALVDGVLGALDQELSDDAAGVDTTVKNAARITRFVPTWNRKGDDFPGTETLDARPHRRSALVEVNPRAIVTAEQLREIASLRRPKANHSTPHVNGTRPTATAGDGPDDAKRFDMFTRYASACPDAVDGERGHNRMFHLVCEAVRFGLDGQWLHQAARWVNDNKCQPPWTDAELEHKVRDARAKAGHEFGRRLNGHHANGATPGHGKDDAGADVLQLIDDAIDPDELYDHIERLAACSKAVLARVKQKLRAKFGRRFSVADFTAAIKEAGNQKRQERLRPASTERSVLTPGGHVDDRGRYSEVGNDDFAEATLCGFPAGLLYNRSTVPVELIGEPGSRTFEPLTCDRMRLLVDASVRLARWGTNGRGEDAVAVLSYQPCSRDHSSLILAHSRNSPRVPQVKIITRVPLYLPDWTLCRPGLNPGGVFYDEPAALRGVEPITCPDTIRDVLEDLVADFPFKAEADRQNLLSGLIEHVIRQAINSNTPMMLILASLERTGKTKLVEQVIGGILLGAPMPAMQFTGSEEEIDKRIISALIRGGTHLHVDNIRNHIDSPALASLLTAATYSGRMLGASQMVELPNTLKLIGTGNNVTMTGEIAKRAVPVMLQPANDSPETRTDFLHPDLAAYVAERRRVVIGCLLGAVELWKAGGQQPGAVAMGGFETWARVVGGIMRTLGYDAWLSNYRGFVRDVDPEGADLREFVGKWREAQHAREHDPADRDMSRLWSPSQLLAIADEAGVFPDCFRSSTEKGRLTAFGMRVLRRIVNTPVTAPTGDQFIVRRQGSGSSAFYFIEEPQS